jgi:hypothetical protein
MAAQRPREDASFETSSKLGTGLYGSRRRSGSRSGGSSRWSAVGAIEPVEARPVGSSSSRSPFEISGGIGTRSHMDEPPFCVPRDSDGRLERRGGALSRSAPARLHLRSLSSDSGWIRSWTRRGAPSSARGSGQNSTARATKNGSRTRNDVRAASRALSCSASRCTSSSTPRGVYSTWVRRRRRDLSAYPDCDSPGGHAIPGLGEASHRSCGKGSMACAATIQTDTTKPL